MNTAYSELISANLQDLYLELNETYYSIPLDPKSLFNLLNSLYSNKEYELYEDILSFLKEEYSDDFSTLFPEVN